MVDRLRRFSETQINVESSVVVHSFEMLQLGSSPEAGVVSS